MNKSTVSPILRAAFGVLLLAVGAQGAPDPLPDSLLATPTAGAVCVLFPAANPDAAFGLVKLNTLEQELSIEWHFKSSGISYASLEKYELSYEPTAVYPKAANSPTFYIAGYTQRTGNVIVEEWNFENITISVTTPQGGGASTASLNKTIRKEMICCTTSLKPLRMIAYNLPAQKLWLFEEQPPNVVWTVDVQGSGAPTALLDSTGFPELPLLLSVQAMVVKPAAPDGGGFLFVYYPWRSWKSQFASPSGFEPSKAIYVVRDGNKDGTWDVAGTMTLDTFFNQKHYFDNLDPHYH